MSEMQDFLAEMETSFNLYKEHNFLSMKGNLILDETKNLKAITIHYERVNLDLDQTDKIILRKNISKNNNISYSITVKRIDSTIQTESILIRENRNEFIVISNILNFFLSLTKILNQ